MGGSCEELADKGGQPAENLQAATPKSAGTPKTPRPASTLARKVQFAVGVTSPLGCGGIFFFGKDVYILRFAADVNLMGVVSTVLAIIGPVIQPLIGYCMEKVSFGTYFPWETWGRRAPWFLTHSLALAVSAAAIFMPPSFDPMLLCWWYLFWTTLGTWLLGVIFNAWESARLEIYPTKEERSDVEAVVKFTAGAGTAFGVILPLVIATEAPFWLLAVASLATFIFGLISLAAVPMLRQARISSQNEMGSFFTELIGGLRIPVARHLLIYRAIEGFTVTTATSASLYHLTFVEGLIGFERSLFSVLAGFSVGLSVFVGLPFWTLFFRVRRQINVNVVCAIVVACGLISPAAMAFRTLLPPGVGYAIWCFTVQGSLSGQTFWRAVALGWTIDEDCHKFGRRREAMLVGLVNFFSSAGRAVGVGVVLLGLGLTGMDMVNCETECYQQGDAAADDCVEICDKGNVARQPEAVKTYVLMIGYIVIPIGQAICAILVYRFPIYGARLDAIYERQAELELPQEQAPPGKDGPE